VNGKDVIAETREAVLRTQAAGVKAIDPEKLLGLLDLMENEVDEAPAGLTDAQAQVHFEQYKAELASWVAQTQHVSTWQLESFKQVITLGQSAIKSITLINGGAAVALLAFIGHLTSATTTKLQILPFAESLRFFVAGVFFSALASGTTYLSQNFYDYDGKWLRGLGVVFHVLTVLIVLAAFVSFFKGADTAYFGFLGVAP
jgi:hypothetical protein